MAKSGEDSTRKRWQESNASYQVIAHVRSSGMELQNMVFGHQQKSQTVDLIQLLLVVRLLCASLRIIRYVSLPLGNHKSQCSIHLLSRQFPEREDFEYGASVGILAIQLYYNLSYKALILGGG